MTGFGLLAVAAVVLTVGGVFKLRDPGPTREMLRTFGLPATDGAARLSGAVEVLVGLAALIVGGRGMAIAVAALFALFALMTARLVQLGDAAASCGCFGRLSARPSITHVAVNLGCVALATIAAVTESPGLAAGWADLDYAGIPQLLLVGLTAWLVIVVMTVLPATAAATRRGPAPAAVRTFEIGELNR